MAIHEERRRGARRIRIGQFYRRTSMLGTARESLRRSRARQIEVTPKIAQTLTVRAPSPFSRDGCPMQIDLPRPPSVVNPREGVAAGTARTERQADRDLRKAGRSARPASS